MTPHVPPTERELLLAIHAGAGDDLRNAAQMLGAQIANPRGDGDWDTMGRAYDLLMSGLEKLAAPNAAAMRNAKSFLPESTALWMTPRDYRDLCAAILDGQLRGSGSRGEPT